MARMLVVFYSRTGKTRWVAGQIAAAVGADLVELREKADRSGALGYLRAGRDAVLKRGAELVAPPDLTQYSVIVLGMPVWGFGPPPAIRALLKMSDLKDKSLRVFCTMDGSGAERTFAAVQELARRPLDSTLALKKVRPGDAGMIERIRAWADGLRTPA